MLMGDKGKVRVAAANVKRACAAAAARGRKRTDPKPRGVQKNGEKRLRSLLARSAEWSDKAERAATVRPRALQRCRRGIRLRGFRLPRVPQRVSL